MTRTPRLLVQLLVVIAMPIAIGASAAQTQQRPDPILILVSFDGWRWDYLDRAKVPNRKALAARGVRATELIPRSAPYTVCLSPQARTFGEASSWRCPSPKRVRLEVLVAEEDAWGVSSGSRGESDAAPLAGTETAEAKS